MILARAANGADAAACAAIYAPYVTDSWVSFETVAPDEGEMARRIAAHGASHGWFVADDGGTIAGYAYASPHRTRAAYASSVDVAVYVAPSHARQGVGRALYERLFDHLRARGFHAAFAGIAIPNVASERLHRSMGFAEVGIYREVGWKMGAWRDVGWWQKPL